MDCRLTPNLIVSILRRSQQATHRPIRRVVIQFAKFRVIEDLPASKRIQNLRRINIKLLLNIFTAFNFQFIEFVVDLLVEGLVHIELLIQIKVKASCFTAHSVVYIVPATVMHQECA